MTGWDALAAELDAWGAAGRTAEFWWRDDDAVAATPALDRLLALRRTAAVPLALAVIPARADATLAAALAGETGIDVLQHGYAHANHRPEGAKKAELGADRPLWDIAREIADGRGRLDTLFGDGGWCEVMVPPWNRIAPAVAALLPGLGFVGLTTFHARAAAEAAPGVTAVNTHVDLIDWPGTRAFAGDEACLAAAVAHLAAKRAGTADAAEPTGMLSHHLAHDEGCWAFAGRFLAVTASHAAVRWRDARTLFPEPE